MEREDQIENLVSTLKPAKKHIQDKMVELYTQCDEDNGRRVAEGLKAADDTMDKGPIGIPQGGERVKEAQE